MSVSENIAYGLPNKDVSHEAIVEAAKAANAHDFIVSLPEVSIEAYEAILQSEPENQMSFLDIDEQHSSSFRVHIVDNT